MTLSVDANRIEALGSLQGLASLTALTLGGNPLDHLAGIDDAFRISRLALNARD